MNTIKKQKDYHAKLVIHNLPEMTPVQEQRLFNWVKGISENLRQTSKKEFAKTYTLKLMK